MYSLICSEISFGISFLFKSKLLHLEHIDIWPMKTHVPHVREAVGSNLGTVYQYCIHWFVVKKLFV